MFAYRFEAKPYLGDLGNMVALFDHVGRLPTPPRAVDTDHALLFTLMTGLSAPLTVTGIGVEPRYTDLILHVPAPPGVAVQQPPRGATLVINQGAWSYYILPQPMTQRELRASANQPHR